MNDRENYLQTYKSLFITVPKKFVIEKIEIIPPRSLYENVHSTCIQPHQKHQLPSDLMELLNNPENITYKNKTKVKYNNQIWTKEGIYISYTEDITDRILKKIQTFQEHIDKITKLMEEKNPITIYDLPISGKWNDCDNPHLSDLTDDSFTLSVCEDLGMNLGSGGGAVVNGMGNICKVYIKIQV